MKKGIITSALLLLFFICGFSVEKRDILIKKAQEINFSDVLIKDFSELNFPDYYNRDFWNNLPLILRQQYIENAEKYLNFDWPIVKATDFLEIIRSGDRRQSVYAAPQAALTALVMGELIEGKGRFIDQIINGVWYYSEQTWWGWSAHIKLQKSPNGLPDIDEPVIDLGVGEVTNTLSWTWFLFREEFNKIHPLIAKRLRDEIMKKAVTPYYERDDFWWMGFHAKRTLNNWNPWTTHNLLTAILILEDNQEKKIFGVQKVIRSLDIFINGYPDDGGCDEGPSYWGRAGASLYQCLDLIKRATKGKFDVYADQLIKNMGSYIYKAYIDYPYFLNFADADAKIIARSQIIYNYGKDIGDQVMQKFGAFLAKKQSWGQRIPDGKIDEQIMDLVFMEEIDKADIANALISDFWLPQTEIAAARDKEGQSEGFFFAAKGGHNGESHNHNDVGSCVMYYDGKPALIDIGRETYTAKTFSSNRYEIWTMQSQYHNLPAINGVDQLQGRNFTANNTSFRSDARKAIFSTDISKAYPEEAAVKTWIRTYELNRGKQFIIRDEYVLQKVLNHPSTLNFITYCKTSELKPGFLLLEGEEFNLEMKYNARNVTPEIEYNKVTDTGLQRYWPEGITRIIFTIKNPVLKGQNEIIIIKHNK